MIRGLMNHHPSHDRKQSHSKGGHGFSAGHVLKLLLLNCVLFLACGAFAGAIVGDSIPDKFQLKVIAAFVLVPLAIAVISTFLHLRSHRWTSVDSMSERMFGGKPSEPGQ